MGTFLFLKCQDVVRTFDDDMIDVCDRHEEEKGNNTPRGPNHKRPIPGGNSGPREDRRVLFFTGCVDKTYNSGEL